MAGMAKIVKPQRHAAGHREFVDIAGLVAERLKGEGPGQPVPWPISARPMPIVNVVRCFDRPERDSCDWPR